MNDIIHGEIHFESSLINQVISTRVFQRLSGLAQNGLYGLMYVPNYPTRYQHSIGTAYLCQLLGTSEEIQLSALLHDLYHTNFSHDIDYLHNETQSFHETNKEQFFQHASGIEELIQLLGTQRFQSLMTTYYSVVKSKQCGADNLDYLLRDALHHQLVTSQWVEQLLKHLSIVDDQIVITNETDATTLTQVSIQVDQHIYNGPDNKACGIYMSRILRLALEKDLIQETQLLYGYQSDQQIWQHLLKQEDPEIGCLVTVFQQSEFFYGPLDPHLSQNRSIFRVKTNIKMRWRFLQPFILMCDKSLTQVSLLPPSPATTYHLWGKLHIE